MPNRDGTFTLAPGAADAPPPFRLTFEPLGPTARCWTLRDAFGRPIGDARTRAGGRAGLRNLHPGAAPC